jgi:uncharacterized membrane protein
MFSLLAGTFIAAVPHVASVVVRVLIGWNVATWSYLVLMAWLITHTRAVALSALAEREDKDAAFVLAVMSLGAVLSLVAVVMELASAKNVSGETRLLHYLFTGTTVMGSWLLLGVIYMFHYAHLYYAASSEDKPLRFPGNTTTSSYWDFLYFAFTVATGAQTSDVSILTTRMRQAVIAQSILSFLFNAAIIGFTINIAAGVVSG